MSWFNPIALVGLAAITLPILVHVMARARAREVRFPTLRFLEGTRHQPARRTRLQDIPLLVLRAAALVAAALAVAGPMFREAPVPEPDGAIARAVVLDTSASMLRVAAAGGEPALPAGTTGQISQTAASVASRVAVDLVQSATAGMIVRSGDPAGALAGAAAWALTRPGRAEIVVVSDFQNGSLVFGDIGALPSGVGVAFRKVGVRADAGPIERRSLQGGAEVVARIGFAAGRTTADYTTTPRAARDGDVEILAERTDRASVAAARAAAAVVGVDAAAPAVAVGAGAPAPGTVAPADWQAHAIAIAFAGYESRDSLIAASNGLSERWQSRIAARVLRDPLLTAAHAVSVRSVARNGRNALVFVSSATPATEDGVALIAAVARARANGAPATELEPATIPDSALASWTREASAREPRDTESPNTPAPSTRWLWSAALLLLGAEALLRRSPAFTNRATPASNRAANDAA